MKNNSSPFWLLAFVSFPFLLFAGQAASDKRAEESGKPRVLVAPFGGIVSPVGAEFLTGAINKAEKEKFEAVIIQLDTPGGLDTSMREIIKSILSSRVPVVVYVYPAGARAASAGVFITVAAHFAAMAPGTNIGAAHPVFLGGATPGSRKQDNKPDEDLMSKVTQDAAAYLKSIAHQRGRNEEWCMQAVSKSTSIPANEAVAINVVDMVAKDLPELLEKLDGRKVDDLGVSLRTKGAEIVMYEMTGRQKILAALSDPNVAMILMSIGAAGIFVELYNPGLILPGVVGLVSLILAFYSFHTLSANFAGVILMFFGFFLFILEIKILSYGLLAFGGIASILLGALMLFDQGSVGGLAVSWAVILTTVGGLAAITVGLAMLYATVHRARPVTGSDGLVGMDAVAQTALSPGGSVFVHGEIWKAMSVEGDISAGEPVTVSGIRGLTLEVRKTA